MNNTVNVTLLQFSQFTAVLLTGLSAGLLYGYDCSVIRSLGKLNDGHYLQAFQHINREIQNPYFFLSFMGSLFVLPVAVWFSRSPGNPVVFYLFLSAAVLYALGVLGVTIFGNIPLNEKIAGFDISSASPNNILNARQVFEKNWNSYHRIRTIAAVLCFGLTILAILKQKV